MIPLALWGAVASLATFQTDPVSAAEGLLLGSLGAAVLLCVALLERPGAGGAGAFRGFLWGVGWGALLTALLLWTVPTGAARGSGTTALLLFFLLVAVARRWGEAPDRLPLVVTAPLCLGPQFLCRPELFLDRPRTWESLSPLWGPALAFALVAALALNLLARRHGARNALLAGGAVLILSGGWTFLGAAGLLALAAAELAVGPKNLLPVKAATGPRTRRKVRGWGHWTPAALLAVGLVAGLGAGVSRRALAFVVLLALVAGSMAGWRRFQGPPSPGGPPPRWLPLSGVFLLGAFVLFLEAAFGPPAREPGEGLRLLILAFALLPQAWMASRLRGLAGIFLAFLAVRWLPGFGMAEAALGGALAFLALALPSRRRGATAQNLWLGGWLVPATLAAGYPWLRQGALEGFTGDGAGAFLPAWTLWLAGVLLVAAAWGIERWLREPRRAAAARRWRPLLPVAAGFVLVAGALVAVEPGGDVVLATEAVTLTEDRPRWRVETEPVPAGRLVVVSNLAFAADLPGGQPVAVLRLRHPDGTTSIAHLRAGFHTAEWSVRRPGAFPFPELVKPAPWLLTAAPDGPYLAQRYRSVHPFEAAEPVVAVDIFRRRNLPPEVSLTLFRVELLP